MNPHGAPLAWLITAAAVLAGCAASGRVDSSAPMKPSGAGGATAATSAPAEDLTRLSDQQLAASIAEQWRRLRDLTSQSLDLALTNEAANLAQNAAYRRVQSDIAMHEQRLTQLQDERRRRETPPPAR